MIWLMPWDADHPARHWPWATWLLMAANAAVFLWLNVGNAEAVDATFHTYGLVASDLRWYQFLTSAFLHADLWHLLGNLLFLYVFGDNVEDLLGPAGLLLLYLVGGLLGDLVFVHANPGTAIPSIGASGCIATLAGAYGVLFFRNAVQMRVMLIIFPVFSFYLQAIWVLLLWFGMDVYLTVSTRGVIDSEGGVNFVAHAIGFVTGAAVGMFAIMHGVRRRFERLPTGHALFGYWPRRLEERPTRNCVALPKPAR